MAYSLPYTEVNGTLADATQVYANFVALLNGLNNSLAKDGSIPAAGPLNMAGYKVYNSAAPVLPGDLTTMSWVQGLGYQTAAQISSLGYLTTATATSTYAPLVSPALTGTPTLNGAPLGSTPAGAVFHFARSVPPTGYLECNGAAVSRTTYAALFAAIGVVFGAGDGSSTFNLPELRGEFIRSWDDGRNVDLARTFGSAQAADIAPHTHPITTLHGTGLDGNGRVSSFAVNGFSDTSTTGQSTGTETRPRNIALLVCIKT